MADDANWLSDLAALALLSVAVHYMMGLYGLLGALMLFIFMQRGAKVQQKKSVESGHALSALEDDVSTNGDDEMPGSEDVEENEQDELVQPCQRVASLVVSDVGSIGVPLEDMEMNSRTPIAFETELFVGRALFLVRTEPEDPFYAALFTGKRRMFWIQVQGQFKQTPKGPVYLGGELPAKISLGVFTRSVALVIMGLIKRLVGQVNFSFGSSSNGKNCDEVPAVAFPLFQSVDQFVETPEGHVPPVLGTSDFGESEERRRQRRLTPLGAEKYTVGPTYTFDFHTMYVDLTRWETANLPSGLNALNLASFFDSLPLRLVAYEVKLSVAEAAGRHRQRDKDYLFSFEVKYDKHGRHRRHLIDSERNQEGGGQNRTSTISGTRLSLMGSDMSTMSTTLSETSSLTGEDPGLVQEHADFIRLEHARRLQQLLISYLCWMEEVDVASDVRRVHYVFVVKDKVGEYDEDDVARPQRLAIISSYELRNLLLTRHIQKEDKVTEELGKLRFHSRSRIGSYSTITTEAQQVVMHLKRLAQEPLPHPTSPSYSSDCSSEAGTCDVGCIEDIVTEKCSIAAQAAFYTCLMKRQCLQESSSHIIKLSPSRIGVNLSRRDREDMKVICEGVVYRYYAAEILRQEVLLLTKDALLFYRSYASSAEKQVSCLHVIGVRVVEMPLRVASYGSTGDTSGAFALQISTFAEEIVVCVGTSFARDAWVRSISQSCDFKTNFDCAQQGELYISFAATTALRPANRVELNSRLLFPYLKHYKLLTEDATGIEASPASTILSALNLVKRTLNRALHILNNVQQLSVTDVLAFLDDASALRSVDLQVLKELSSHEEQIAFYLNLYHTILAHAMIAKGFPRGRGQWNLFFTRTCYALGCGPDGEQVTLSLAEIEHVILRARLPRAELPHLSVASVMTARCGSASRLHDLGLAHPDFRLSLALVVNHMNSDKIVIYEPESVHDQLNAVLRSLLKRSSAQGCLELKDDANTIVLPRVCEWYRHDFRVAGSCASQPDDDESALYCVRKLLGFMDASLQLQVINALGVDDAPLRAKFRSFKYTPKTTLIEDISCRGTQFKYNSC